MDKIISSNWLTTFNGHWDLVKYADLTLSQCLRAYSFTWWRVRTWTFLKTGTLTWIVSVSVSFRFPIMLLLSLTQSNNGTRPKVPLDTYHKMKSEIRTIFHYYWVNILDCIHLYKSNINDLQELCIVCILKILTCNLHKLSGHLYVNSHQAWKISIWIELSNSLNAGLEAV